MQKVIAVLVLFLGLLFCIQLIERGQPLGNSTLSSLPVFKVISSVIEPRNKDYPLLLGGATTTAGQLRLAELSTNGTDYVALRAASSTNTAVWTLPSSDGTVNQSLLTDGSGNLSWGSAAAGGGWTDDGTIVRLTTATDIIGMATTTPTSLLHIVQTGSANAFQVDDQSGDDSPFVISTAGNVGLGTTAPRSKFVVA